MTRRRARTGRRWRAAAWTLVCSGLVAVGGCAATRDTPPSQAARPSGTQRAGARTAVDGVARLYLSRAPYARLHVEIDAVRTLVPKARELAIFERFLRRYCDKPEGITIALDDRLSEGALAGEDPALVALRHMDGPPQGGGESAYLYVLIFDSRLESRPVPDPPRVLRSCPTAILIDRAWLLAHRKPTIGQRALLAVALVHGAGEVLGLWPEANGRPAGCADRGCVMDRAIFDVSPLDVTLGRASLDEPRLCAPCRARLLAGRAGKAPGNLRFVGPALVRSAQGYYVASLPFYSWLGIGEAKDLAVDELLANAVAYMEQRPGYHARGVSYVDGAVPWPLAPERRKAVAAALRRAARDPDRAVARLARLLERKLRARLAGASGG